MQHRWGRSTCAAITYKLYSITYCAAYIYIYNYIYTYKPRCPSPRKQRSPRIAPRTRFSSGAAMPSFVDAADAAGAAQGSSALVVATGAAVAAGHDDFSVVVAAASSPPLRQSDSGQCRKRLRRTDFPDISDTEYREMMQRRRKEQETTRDRGRVRTGRSYPAREEQQRRSHEYRAASERRMSAWLLKAAPVPPQPLASPPKQSCSWNSDWSECSGASAGNGPADFCKS